MADEHWFTRTTQVKAVHPTGLPKWRVNQLLTGGILSVKVAGIRSASCAALGVLVGCQDTVPFRFSCSEIDLARKLSLIEQFAIPVGPNRPIAVADDSNIVAVLTEGSTEVELIRNGGQRTDIKVRSNPLALAFTGSGSLEVYDGETHSVQQIRQAARGPQVAQVTELARPPMIVHTATRAFDGWYVGGVTASGKYVLYQHQDRGLRPVFQFAPTDENPFAAANVSYSNGFLIVNEVRSPYRTAILNKANQVVSAFEIKLHTAGVQPNAYLTAMPMVAGSSGFLVTFADTRSDERFLARIRNDGTVTRLRRLTSPFALVQLSHDRKYIIAVRYRTKPELVFYACANGGASA